ncbi:unnamed protein product [Prorocentrum cordatum]|uniref:JmjC domain-containing protein n=1 Tax=Prorocentrum cordatum TaxID=2364126 RepID=A0ABN9PEZ9_9DINO|nr:unnamed protein product [Polarella glacialis]
MDTRSSASGGGGGAAGGGPPKHLRQSLCRGSLLLVAVLGYAGNWLYPSDDLSQICEALPWFLDNPPAVTVPTEGNVRAFMRACKQVFPTLSEPMRTRLRILAVHQHGRLDDALPCPEFCPPFCLDHVPKADPAVCASGFPKKKDEHIGKEDLHFYNQHGIRPLQARRIEPHQILDAWKAGEVATFDARKLLPEHLFGISIQDIATKLGDKAHDIPFNVRLFYGAEPLVPGSHFAHKDPSPCEDAMRLFKKYQRIYGSRSMFTRLMRLFWVPWTLWRTCYKEISLAKVAELSKNFDTTPLHYSPTNATAFATEAADFIPRLASNRGLGNSNLHYKKIPQLLEGIDMAKKIGIQDMVIGTHTYWWFGISGGDFHPDAQDNFLIQLTEKIEAIIIPPNCSSLVFMNHFNKHPELRGAPEFYMEQKQVPFYHVTLQPGYGVLIPSRAAHRIISGSSQRVGLNFFFEPKFGEMVWGGSPHNFYNMQNPNVAVLRELWMRALSRMFDDTGRVMAMHTSKLEYL